MPLSLTQFTFLALSLLAGLWAGAIVRRPAAPPSVSPAMPVHPARTVSTVVPRVLSFGQTVPDLLARIEALPLPTDSQLGPEATETEHAAAVALACAGCSADALPALFAAVASSKWPPAEELSALRMLARQWAEFDPEGALAAVRTIGPTLPQDGNGPPDHALRAAIEITWARREPVRFREYIHSEVQGVTEAGGIYFPGPATVKAEPALAMNLLFARDLEFFQNFPEADYPGNPLGYGTGGSTTTDLNRDYAAWITRRPAEAAAWAKKKLAIRDLPSGLAFYLIDQLNENGASAAAAPLAVAHLPENLAANALERILPRWLAADRFAAEAWMEQHRKPL